MPAGAWNQATKHLEASIRCPCELRVVVVRFVTIVFVVAMVVVVVGVVVVVMELVVVFVVDTVAVKVVVLLHHSSLELLENCLPAECAVLK